MKIVHIVQTLDVGGLEHIVVQMASEQSRRGENVEIVCLGREGALAEIAEANGVTVRSMGPSRRPSGLGRARHGAGSKPLLILRLRKAIRESGADIVHTHNMGPLIYGSLAARLAGVRCINTRHGRAAKKAPSFIWNANEFVAAVSEDAKSRMMQFNRIAPDKVRMIHNGIAVGGQWAVGREQGAGSREQGATTGNSFTVATVGRLSWEKNQALLLTAFADFRKEAGDSRLVIVGDGADRADLENMAGELGIRDDVQFLGYRGDVSELMEQADVFVLPSLEEGLSLTLLEAMAASLPVIATDAGGNSEAVVDGETGIIVPSENVETLASALLKLYNDKGLRRKMATAGRKRVEEHFSLKKMVDEYMKLYEQAIDLNRR